MHGEGVVILLVVYFKLLRKVFKGIEGMSGIKPLIVLPMAALHLAVMPWCIGTNYLVLNPMLPQTHLEKSGLIPVGDEPIGKFGAIVRLDTLNRAWEGFYKVFHKKGRRKGTVFFKYLHKTPPGILINGSILEEMFANHAAVYKAGRGNKFHMHLYTLPEFNAENNKTCMGVTPAHIGNKFNLVRGMLFRVVRSAGKYEGQD